MFHYGFCDLNVNVDGIDKKSVTTICKTLREKGFRTIALNQIIGEGSFKPKKKKGKHVEDGGAGLVPEPITVEPIEGVDDLKILNRITVHMSDPSQLYQLRQSIHFIKYHLFAVIPMNQNILQQVCGLNEVDIISFQPESKAPYRLSRKLYNMAVEKTIYFEIPYGPAILDDTCRKNIITTAHQYFSIGKSKNVIISSCGTYPYTSIRGPYDIVHLGLIFGLNDVRTKETITKNSAELIYRAETRRRRKSCLTTIKLVKSQNKEEKVLNFETKEEQPPSNLQRPLKKIKMNELSIEM